MARICEICGKGPRAGNRISHAHNVTKRRWEVNLQPARIQTPSGARRARVCTACIKSGKVIKAGRPGRAPATAKKG